MSNTNPGQSVLGGVLHSVSLKPTRTIESGPVEGDRHFRGKGKHGCRHRHDSVHTRAQQKHPPPQPPLSDRAPERASLRLGFLLRSASLSQRNDHAPAPSLGSTPALLIPRLKHDPSKGRPKDCAAPPTWDGIERRLLVCDNSRQTGSRSPGETKTTTTQQPAALQCACSCTDR